MRRKNRHTKKSFRVLAEPENSPQIPEEKKAKPANCGKVGETYEDL
jgi:hypothetical protein